ncbi:MAG: glycosyl hydrolase [Oscillospiraceae bacterium]
MNKNMIKTRLIAIFAAAGLLCGCTAIPDRDMTSSAPEQTATAEVVTEEAAYEEVRTKTYPIDKEDYSFKLNAEGGTFTGNVRTDGEFDGKGYIVLDEGMKLQHIADVPTSQHYRISVAAHSYKNAVIRLKTVNETVGAIYVPGSATTEFTMFAVDSVYLSAGPNIITLEVIEGSAAVDYLLVENTSPVRSASYDISSTCVGSETAVSALGLMRFFADNYGKYTITGQCVTPGTNAEIEAVTRETGRSPAMRTGDLMYSTPSVYEQNKEAADDEVRLALEWGRSGGIVSFNWHWYAPSGHSAYYADTSDFILGNAVCDRDICMADAEELEALLESGLVTEDTVALVQDIDAIAEVLKQFRSESVPVVFQPLADGDSDMYWWCGSPKNFKWLWQLVFDRLDKYHSLNNMIWVWNGSDPDYYPGDKYCDIVGQSFFENSSASFAGRFSALAGIGTDVIKALAVTACDKLPSPDCMRRDNAVWLWFSIASGNTIIDNYGELSEKYNSWQSLHDAFNSTACITLDELPDFREYAFID